MKTISAARDFILEKIKLYIRTVSIQNHAFDPAKMGCKQIIGGMKLWITETEVAIQRIIAETFINVKMVVDT